MIPDLNKIFENSFQTKEGTYKDYISKEDIDLIFEHKLFKCFLPESLGGLGYTFTQTLQIIEDASFINGSLGWLIQIGNGGMYFVTNFEEEVAKKLFTPLNAVIAGSGTPTSAAEPVDGGYIVSGKWKFCSGSDYATLFTITFTLNDTDEIYSAIIPRDQVQVLDDWDTIGMRNTSTNSIQVENVFVAKEFLFQLSERESFLDEKIFSLPFILYAQAFFIHVVYGVFKRMLSESETILLKKEEIWKIADSVRYKNFKKLISEAYILLEDEKHLTNSIVLKLIDPTYKSDSNYENKLQNEFFLAAENIRKFAHTLYAALGIDVLYRSHPIAICYADLLSASQHKLLNK